MLEVKKGLLILAAAMLTLFMAACGNNTDDTAATNDPAATNASETAGQTEAAETPAVPQGTLTVEGAADEVDMGKVEGEKLSDTTPEDSNLEASGEIGNFEVAIEDAKVFDYEGQRVIALSYKFTSHNASPTSFSSVLSTEVTQDGNNLAPIVVLGVEGLNTNSMQERVENDDTITVQETFILSNEQSDVNVVVHKYDDPSGASVSKAFSLQ